LFFTRIFQKFNKNQSRILFKRNSMQITHNGRTGEMPLLLYRMSCFAFQVRNAIQALQELATSNTGMGARYPHPLPAHSNPNLPDNSQKHCNVVVLPRSSSHPPEIFCWENSEAAPGTNANFMLDKETQTGLDLLEQYILHNPHHVLFILGLDADAILGGKTTHPTVSTGNTVRPSDMTVPSNNIVNTRNHCSNKVTSMTQPTYWITQLPQAPSFWQQQQPHHRFSAGDIDEKFRAVNPLPTTRSLKFQPFTS
jgi:hypothetical protein